MRKEISLDSKSVAAFAPNENYCQLVELIKDFGLELKSVSVDAF